MDHVFIHRKSSTDKVVYPAFSRRVQVHRLGIIPRNLQGFLDLNPKLDILFHFPPLDVLGLFYLCVFY